ncbi:MAG TPA: hypothetical protein VN285_09730 [Candidatus Deferrimicrobium sp.]|nr:hypothetical protein [Candidatus Deferrimicrobium sp.]
MSYSETLASLERLLESFLDRAVAAKGERLQILEGLNRLDDIVGETRVGGDVVESIGEWFADHRDWLKENGLRPADSSRLTNMLEEIRTGLEKSADSSPASHKIRTEVDRWAETTREASRTLVLKRGAEEAPKPAEESIAAFGRLLEKVGDLFKDMAGNRKHLMSVLDESLRAAGLQKNKEALLLSGFIIYYLKTGGYKVDPYVRRLKQAEAESGSEGRHA